MIVIGDKGKDAKVITAEERTPARPHESSGAGGEKLEDITVEKFLEKLQKEISERTLN